MAAGGAAAASAAAAAAIRFSDGAVAMGAEVGRLGAELSSADCLQDSLRVVGLLRLMIKVLAFCGGALLHKGSLARGAVVALALNDIMEVFLSSITVIVVCMCGESCVLNVLSNALSGAVWLGLGAVGLKAALREDVSSAKLFGVATLLVTAVQIANVLPVYGSMCDPDRCPLWFWISWFGPSVANALASLLSGKALAGVLASSSVAAVGSHAPLSQPLTLQGAPGHYPGAPYAQYQVPGAPSQMPSAPNPSHAQSQVHGAVSQMPGSIQGPPWHLPAAEYAQYQMPGAPGQMPSAPWPAHAQSQVHGAVGQMPDSMQGQMPSAP